jgi:hypothetical protein
MKALTRNLMYFAVLFFIGAIVFRYSLSESIENRTYNLIWIIAVIYFFFNFFIGWIFGKRDYETLPLYDIGFRFHFATYLLFNSVSVLWFYLEFHSQFEQIEVVYTIAITWGIFLLMHFVFYLYAQRQTFKGINKKDIFE